MSLTKKCEMSFTGDHPWETYHYIMGVVTCIVMVVTMMLVKVELTWHSKF